MAEKIQARGTGEFRRAVAAAFPCTVPVLTGFAVLGMAYGVLMHSVGYGTLWSVLMSATAFCGSMQFAAVALLTTAFHPVQALVLSLMVNARHLFYGLSMLERYRGVGRKTRLLLIYTLCDETFSIVSSVLPPPDVPPRRFYTAVSLLDYLYWVFGTLLGGVVGALITVDTTGLDFVLTALFVVLFMEQMKDRSHLEPGLIGIGGSCGALAVFGPENMVIPSMIVIVLILLLRRKKR
jgi:4-azaleucine resistance transporter AzlC